MIVFQKNEKNMNEDYKMKVSMLSNICYMNVVIDNFNEQELYICMAPLK